MQGQHVDSTYEELMDIIRNTYEDPDLSLIEQAYTMASNAHADKRRQTGHEYISHPVSCAFKLAEMKLSLDVVAAGLLHDVIEDTDVTLEEIQEAFGDEIAQMVDAVTKLKKVKYLGNDYYAENMRRMFLAFSKDIRVVFIKFADRIHNLKTLYARPREKQIRVARETLEIYAPIANRLGMGMMRGDLEDLAFMYAMPKEYENTATLLERIVRKKEDLVNKTIGATEIAIKNEGIICLSIHGRIKRLFSLYRKMQKYKQDVTKIYDIVAIRIIVDDVTECYGVLGILHSLWKPLSGRIKDYIAQPKPNSSINTNRKAKIYEY